MQQIDWIKTLMLAEAGKIALIKSSLMVFPLDYAWL